MTTFAFPWDADDVADAEPAGRAAPDVLRPRPRGRRPQSARRTVAAPAWLYHHLVVTGPADGVRDFASAARGTGVTPWRLDGDAMEEDVFNIAVSRPPKERGLDVEGCRILARQVRERAEAREARDRARAAAGRTCPFDLHALLPVPEAVLRLGPAHPVSLAWLGEHWGVAGRPRHVTALPDPGPGRRLPRGAGIVGYGFFTATGETPVPAVARLAAGWTALRLALRRGPG